jgi:hypothetical protein
MEKKLRELARKYEIPLELLQEAIAMEKEKVILQNRMMGSKLVELIEGYADSSN